MPYVPGYENDIFLSYARADDQAWVALFEENLRENLGRELGQKVHVWQDVRSVGVAEDWRDEIAHGIKHSAAFLTVVSPSYRTSEWCAKERDFFLKQFCSPEEMALQGMPCLDKMRVGRVFRFFKIIKAPWPENKHEKFLARLQYSRFYSDRDGASDYVEFSAGTDDFQREIRRTALAVAELLRRMRSSLEKIFVACPAPDMADSCARLRQDLHDQNYNVRPVGIAEIDFTLTDLLTDELDNAIAAVFLLGPAYDPFVEFQLSQAAAKGVRPLIWIRPDAALRADERQRKLIESVSKLEHLPGSTRILPGAHERVMIEDVRALLRSARHPAAQTDEGRRGGVYMICDPTDNQDRFLAERWRGEIEDREGLDVFLPSRKSYQQRHEELLRQCDGLLLFQNHAPARWLQENAMDVRLAERLFQRPPLRSKGFLIADTRPFADYGVPLIPEPENIDLGRLEPFLAPLRSTRIPHASS